MVVYEVIATFLSIPYYTNQKLYKSNFTPIHLPHRLNSAIPFSLLPTCTLIPAFP